MDVCNALSKNNYVKKVFSAIMMAQSPIKDLPRPIAMKISTNNKEMGRAFNAYSTSKNFFLKILRLKSFE